MKQEYCKTCGMPMRGREDLLGTNADGSKNQEHCVHCLKDGAFVEKTSMEGAWCQSCGMPLDGREDLLGTNADGSKNEEYCAYCFKDGAFTANVSMEEMIAFCVEPMVKAHPEMTRETAEKLMRTHFPRLKRWAGAK